MKHHFSSNNMLTLIFSDCLPVERYGAKNQNVSIFVMALFLTRCKVMSNVAPDVIGIDKLASYDFIVV